MKTLILLAAAAMLAGCSAPGKYTSGENFNREGVSCGSRQEFYGGMPWCPERKL